MSTPAGYQRLVNLLHFARVVEAGSFAEAARRAGTTTSALSKAVSRFERQNGVRLLHRSTHSLSLTDEGERLLEGARDLLREAERLEAALDHAAANGAGGRIRLGAPAPLIRACLARQVPTLLPASPGIDLDLKVDDGTLDLAAGSIDVAIRFGALIGQPGLVATPLGSFPWVLVATPRYVEAMGVPETPADLGRHHQIGYRSRERAAGRLAICRSRRWCTVAADAAPPAGRRGCRRRMADDAPGSGACLATRVGGAGRPARRTGRRTAAWSAHRRSSDPGRQACPTPNAAPGSDSSGWAHRGRPTVAYLISDFPQSTILCVYLGFESSDPLPVDISWIRRRLVERCFLDGGQTPGRLQGDHRARTQAKDEACVEAFCTAPTSSTS